MARHCLRRLSATTVLFVMASSVLLTACAGSSVSNPSGVRQFVQRNARMEQTVRTSSGDRFQPGGLSLPSEPDLATPRMLHLAMLARREKVVHGFGMPANWANLGRMWDTFYRRFGVKPEYRMEGGWSSWEEIQAFKTERNPAFGDVGDVGISYGPIAVQQRVAAAYKNSHWNQIPTTLKDPNGYWATAYYGVIGFEVNTDRVKHIPHTWSDLLKPEYRRMIGFADPRRAAVSFDAVIAASYANGGTPQNIAPGVAYFRRLFVSKNWAGADVNTLDMQSGHIAIGITWNYLGYADAKRLKRQHIAVVVPSDATVAGPYVEIINRYAPHPNAARLLNEYLFSDAGQTIYAESGAYPVRLPYLTLPKNLHLQPLQLNKVHFITGDSSHLQTYVNQVWSKHVLGE